MTKYEIVDSIANATGMRKQDIKVVVEMLFSGIKTAMEREEDVYFRGFGTFHVAARAPKVARNISKGEAIKLPARKVVTFKPGKELSCMFSSKKSLDK